MNIASLFRHHTPGIALAALLSLLPAAPAMAYTYTFGAFIDGISELHIKGNTVQWNHLMWDVPGKGEEDLTGTVHDDPTQLTSADMGTVDWYPAWSLPFNEPQWSDVFTGLIWPLAAQDQSVGMSIGQAGSGSVYISQQPSAGNDYTLVITFDDEAPPGAAWYEVTVDASAAPIPVPTPVVLLGSSLVVLVIRWRRAGTLRTPDHVVCRDERARASMIR